MVDFKIKLQPAVLAALVESGSTIEELAQEHNLTEPQVESALAWWHEHGKPARNDKVSNAILETLKHRDQVQGYIGAMCCALLERGLTHDESKLHDPELETFTKYAPKLKGSTYGSDEYKRFLAEMKPALEHHYAENRHHPEHFSKHVCNGCFKEFKVMPNHCDVCGYSQFQEEADISQMTLVDLVEMLCDWKAATLRHADGDIGRSIDINQKRFGYSDELRQILINTADLFDADKGGKT